MRFIPFSLAAVFLVLGAAHAGAQVHLHGRVIEDASGDAIGGATVSLHDGRGRRIGRATTDDLGQFRFDVQSGPVTLRTEHPGFRRTLSPSLDFGAYGVLRVEVRMDPDLVLMAPLEVVARSRTGVSPTLAGFEQRRTSGTGVYITRSEIESRNPNAVTDILAMVPGVTVQRRAVFMARSSNCPAQVYIDGFHINRPAGPVGRRTSLTTTEMFPIDDMLKPGSVEGIEIYQGLSRVPAEFLSPEAVCGVVAIWTRRGG